MDRPAKKAVKTRAIVFDTNSFGRGQLNLGFLRRWVRDARAVGLEVWIPETVIWELAAHLGEVIEDLRARTVSASEVIERAGLRPPGSLILNSGDALVVEVTDLIESLGDGVEVIPCKGEHALEAIKDQILQRSPARKKKEVRTGAADSAWLRSVDEYEPDTKQYVIISNDEDVDGAFEAWGKVAPRRFTDPTSTREELFHYGLAPHDLTYQALRVIDEAIREGRAIDVLQMRSVPDVSVISERFGFDQTGLRVVATSVEAITRVVGSGRVKISERSGTALLQIEVLAQLELHLAPAEGALVEPPAAPLMIPNAVIRAPLAIEVKEGEVQSVAPDQAPWALHTTLAWDTPEAAVEDCVESLWSVPELSDEELSFSETGKWEFSVHLHDGTKARLSFVSNPDRTWVLQVDTDIDPLKIVARRGPRRHKWRVQLDGPYIDDTPGSFAVSSYLLNRALRRSGSRTLEAK